MNFLTGIKLIATAVCILCTTGELFGQQRIENAMGRIDARLQLLEDGEGFSGVVLVGKGDEIIFQKGYGWADPVAGMKNNAEKRFMIASVSKAFVAACVLQLQERGLLHVEDKIGEYLPNYPAWAGERISIHQLLTHTSGIPDYINDFPLKFKLKKATGWSPSKDELIAEFQDQPLNFIPGTQFKYSNSGYVLLAKIVENVSGMDYDVFLYRNILKPLGMESTGLGDFDLVGNRAVGYKDKGRNRVRTFSNFENEWIFGMGEIYSNAIDLNKWLQSFSDTLILSEASKKLMFQTNSFHYAYGWHVYDVYGKQQFSHGGYLPGWNSYVYFYPEDSLSVVVLSNNEKTNPMEICATVSRVLYANGVGEDAISSRNERFSGRYEIMFPSTAGKDAPFQSDIVTVSEQDDLLELKTPRGQKMRFTRQSRGEWLGNQDGWRLNFREAGGSVLLQVSRNGQEWNWRKLSGDYQAAHISR